MPYRRCGRSGLLLPAISLGLWWNFGHDRPLETSRAIVRRAFDLGITHFDLANNYGPPYGSAEENFGRCSSAGPAAVPRRARHLDEGRLRHVAGPVRRPGLAQVPAREPRPEPRAHGARLRRHLLLAPLRPGDAARGDDGRARHGRSAGQGALRRASRRTRPRRRARRRRSCATSARRSSSTSRRTRCSTAGSSPSCSTRSASSASAASRFSPLAQGMLTDKYLDGIPDGSRASRPSSLSPDLMTDETLEKIRALERDRSRSRPDARADGARLGAPRPARDLGAHRRIERRSARGQRRGARTARRSPPTSSPRSTATRPTSEINIWAASSEE